MPNTIGRYEVLEKVGEGGMGVVYRAFDPLLRRVVAVKVISAVMAPRSEIRERFFREARAAGQLTHKNIIVIHDLGEEQGQPYLSMEYLTGVSLEQWMRHSGRLPLDEALHIAYETCQGLEYAHVHGVIHRDIKPANLFITEDGELKILDFGLARLATSELTRSESVMGTANYMPPELVKGERVDHRADVFAVGAVLYELISGRKAFEADSIATTLFRIVQESPPPLVTYDATIPPELVAVVDRALAKRREDRYQSIGEMARDLVACSALVKSDSPGTALQMVLQARRSSIEAGAGVPGGITLPEQAAHAARSHRGSRSWSAARSMLWSPRRVRTTAMIGIIVLIALAGVMRLPDQPPGERALSTSSGTPAPSESSGVAATAPQVSAPAVSPQTVGAQPETPPVSTPSLPTPSSAPTALPVPVPGRGAAVPERPPVDGRGGDDVRTIDTGAQQAALDRTAADEAAGRMRQAKATAEATGAPALAGSQYNTAVAREGEAGGAYAAGQYARSTSLYVQAEALFQAADIAARAEQAARDRLRSIDAAAAGRASPPEAPKPEDVRPSPPPPRAVEQPGPVPPAAPAPPPSQQAIRDLVQQYIAALEGRNLTALMRIWPSLGGAQERALRAEFQNARSLSVQLTDQRIEVNGESATMTAIREYILVTGDGQRLSTTTRTTFTFRRNGTGWIIANIAYQLP